VNTPVGSRDQFTISCADKWRHNDVIVEKVIKIHDYYTKQLIRMLTNMQRRMLGPTSYLTSIPLAAEL